MMCIPKLRWGGFCLSGLLLILGAGLAGSGAWAAGRVNKQAEDGSIKLGAADAQIQGANARLEGGDEKDIIWWTGADTALLWNADVLKPGKYRVELSYAVAGKNNGNPLSIAVGDRIVKAVPKAGDGVNEYQIGYTDEITIAKAGPLQISMKPALDSPPFVIAIRSVVLWPVETASKAIDIRGGAILPMDDGTYQLKAADAGINGPNAILEGNAEKNIGFWQDVGTSVSWMIGAENPGTYRVELNYSLADKYAGSKVAVTVGGQTVRVKLKAGNTWTEYLSGRAGEVRIERAGEVAVIVKPLSRPYGYVMNLRSVTLSPVESPTKAIDIRDAPVSQAEDGSFELREADAEIDGRSVRIEGSEDKYLAWWNNSDRGIRWPIKVDRPGAFRVMLRYSIEAGVGDTQIEIIAGGQRIAASLPPGTGLDDQMTANLGEIAMKEPGECELVLGATKAIGARVMNLRSVLLIPVPKD